MEFVKNLRPDRIHGFEGIEDEENTAKKLARNLRPDRMVDFLKPSVSDDTFKEEVERRPRIM